MGKQQSEPSNKNVCSVFHFTEILRSTAPAAKPTKHPQKYEQAGEWRGGTSGHVIMISRHFLRLRRQRERHKRIVFNQQHNGFARALYILVHFFAVLCQTAT